MKIGIIGSGHVGGTLGKRWAANGHAVIYSSGGKHPDLVQKLVADSGPSASSAPVAEACRNSEILLLATPWSATQAALSEAGGLNGKILMDATNPLLPTLDGLATGPGESAGELVAQWAHGALVVKAFNTVGSNVMANPSFPGGGRAAMFYCGDDAGAKKVVAGLIGELGFDAFDAGPLAQSRVLEHFALMWVSLAIKNGYGVEIAFQFLRR